jgi:ATP-dependent 26S proteasome regulatory subunit
LNFGAMQILNQLLSWLAHFFRFRGTTGRRDELTILAQKIVPRGNLQLSWLSASQKAILNDVYHRMADTHHPRGDATVLIFTGAGVSDQREVAEALANDLQRDLYRVDLNMVVSKYVGETEKNLRSLFRAAESAGTILFFDEADALFGKRSEVNDSHDRYANIEVSYLLRLLETYDGLAILTTNKQSTLDDVRDRFDLVLDFPCRPCP